MSNKLKKNTKEQEPIVTSVRQFLAYLLDGMVCVCMLLLIVVMPFYHEQGYAYIGTNKAMFFRNVCVNGATFIIPTVILYWICLWVERQAADKTHVRNGIEVATKRKECGIKDRCKSLWKLCRKHLSVTDMFALLYGVSLLLSYLFSEYRDATWQGTVLWGSDGWFMGLLPQLFLLGIYFMISRLWKRRTWMFLLFLPVSAVVFVLGYLNRFGIYPIDMGLKSASFISTIGNINWYCGYVVSVFFGGYYLLLQGGVPAGTGNMTSLKNGLVMAYVLIGFATLVTQGSMSGMVALAVMLVVAFCMATSDGQRMVNFWQGTLLLSLACLGTWCLRNVFGWESMMIDPIVEILTNSRFPLIVTLISLIFLIGVSLCHRANQYPARLFGYAKWLVGGGASLALCVVIGMIVVNTLYHGSIGSLSDNPFFTFSNAWGSGRGATWKAGWMCFAEQNILHKAIGVGPDTMEGYISLGASEELKELVKRVFNTNRLTNAHCEWLTILVDGGVLGVIAFGGMIVSGIMRFIKCGKINVIAGACGFCLLAYVANNIFSFQQSMSVATIFVLLGIGEAHARACAIFYA